MTTSCRANATPIVLRLKSAGQSGRPLWIRRRDVAHGGLFGGAEEPHEKNLVDEAAARASVSEAVGDGLPTALVGGSPMPKTVSTATTSTDSTVRMWNLVTGAEVRTLAGHTGLNASSTASSLSPNSGLNETRRFLSHLGQNTSCMPDHEALAWFASYEAHRNAAWAAFPDAEPVLRKLAPDYRLGIVSSSSDDHQRDKLHAIGLLPLLRQRAHLLRPARRRQARTEHLPRGLHGARPPTPRSGLRRRQVHARRRAGPRRGAARLLARPGEQQLRQRGQRQYPRHPLPPRTPRRPHPLNPTGTLPTTATPRRPSPRWDVPAGPSHSHLIGTFNAALIGIFSAA